MRQIPIFRPSCTSAEILAVKKVLESGWWGAGPKVLEFENEFAKYLGVPSENCVALSSATAALHLAGKVIGIYSGEVIIPAITFVSSAYIADYNQGIPVFCDVEKDTLNIDVDDAIRKITPKTKIIIAVHYGGRPANIERLAAECAKRNIMLIEDCAHAAGSYLKGKPLGTFGDMSLFSFQAVKNLAMGDGGLLYCKDRKLADRVRKLRWLGISKETGARTNRDQYSWEYSIDEIGYKYQLTDICAAIGLVQLKRLEKLNDKRRNIVSAYNKAFSSIKWIETPKEGVGAKSAWHNYVIKVPNRNGLMTHLKSLGISSTVHYMPLYKHAIYSKIKSDCPIAESEWLKILNLPIYPDMTSSDIKRVIDGVKSFKN